MEQNLYKDMSYTNGKIRVSGFRKSTGKILKSQVKCFTDQNINALKIAKNSKTYEVFRIINSDLDQSKASIFAANH